MSNEVQYQSKAALQSEREVLVSKRIESVLAGCVTMCRVLFNLSAVASPLMAIEMAAIWIWSYSSSAMKANLPNGTPIFPPPHSILTLFSLDDDTCAAAVHGRIQFWEAQPWANSTSSRSNDWFLNGTVAIAVPFALLMILPLIWVNRRSKWKFHSAITALLILTFGVLLVACLAPVCQ